MMTHELARQLLAGPDEPVELRLEYDDDVLCGGVGEVTINRLDNTTILFGVADDEDEEDDEEGDDLCDLCMSSGVNVTRTTYCGKTIGQECGCEDGHPDGKCGDDACEACALGSPEEG